MKLIFRFLLSVVAIELRLVETFVHGDSDKDDRFLFPFIYNVNFAHAGSHKTVNIRVMV